MRLDPNDPAVIAAMNDHLTLALFVVEDKDHDFGPAVRSTVRAALAENGDCVTDWWRLCSYVLFVLDWNGRYRPLSEHEHRVRAIAVRLYDACDRAAKRLGVTPWPPPRRRERK